METTQY